MKVFITGASGFIGANLVKELVARGDKVHILTRPNSDLWRLTPILKRLHCHRADIQNKKAIEKIISRIKPAIIYHLSVYGAYHYQTDTEQIFRTALNGTLNLLLTAKKAGVKMFINTGSSSEYGRKNHPMCENEILEPNTYYAVAKAGQTLLCQNFAVSEKLPVITLRLFSVYGDYEEPGRLIPTLIKNALSGQKLSLASPKIARDFIYVKDLVAVIGWMLHHMYAQQWDTSKNGLYNLGTGKARSFYDLAANTFIAQGLEPNIEFVDMPEDIRDKYQYFTEANMAKLRAAGYDKPFSSLEEGVHDYVANYLVPAKGY